MKEEPAPAVDESATRVAVSDMRQKLAELDGAPLSG